MKTRKVTFTLLMVVGFMILFMTCSPEAEAAGKLKTITVTKINQKTARKVHKQLMQGKAFKIRFKGAVKSPYPAVRQKNFYPKCERLMKKVAKCTDYGFNLYPIFYAGIGSGDTINEKGEYLIYTVKKKYCQEYIYGIKFAKRELGDLRTRIKEIISETEAVRSGLINGTVSPAEEHDNIISRAENTVTSLKKLDNYLAKTKFRNLSETMKARILLEVCHDDRPWGKPSMVYRYNKRKHLDTFKALYQRQAYGCRSSTFARLACKTCAVFDIGDFDYLGDSGIYAAARVKMKTSGGKVRYAIVDGGSFESYNSFVGYKILDFNVKYRKSHKKIKPIKKINENTQQLKELNLSGRTNEVYNALTGGGIMTYYFDLPKSEW